MVKQLAQDYRVVNVESGHKPESLWMSGLCSKTTSATGILRQDNLTQHKKTFSRQ